eukprot:Lankesteria_metandrocarpae@DN2394_c0_g1_i1.p1
MLKAGFLLNQDAASVAVHLPEVGPCQKLTPDHFEVERFIGCGNFSEVFLVTLKNSNNKRYAMKVFEKDKITRLEKQADVLMEKHALTKLNDPGHPNVVHLHHTFKTDTHLYITYDFCEGGDVWELVQPIGLIDEDFARNLIEQLLDALEYIHSRGVVHRDLKCENLMICPGGRVKLIDFGTAMDLENDSIQAADNRTKCCRDKKIFRHYVGTAEFLPPEAFQNKSSGKETDLWALGCTIYQILAGRSPFASCSDYFTFCRALDLNLQFPTAFPPQAADLVKRLLVIDPSKRLGAGAGMDEIRQHPYFTSTVNRMYSDITPTATHLCPSLQHLSLQAIALRYDDVCDRWQHRNLLDNICCATSSAANNYNVDPSNRPNDSEVGFRCLPEGTVLQGVDDNSVMQSYRHLNFLLRKFEKISSNNCTKSTVTDFDQTNGHIQPHATLDTEHSAEAIHTSEGTVQSSDSSDVCAPLHDGRGVTFGLDRRALGFCRRCDEFRLRNWQESHEGYWCTAYSKYLTSEYLGQDHATLSASSDSEDAAPVGTTTVIEEENCSSTTSRVQELTTTADIPAVQSYTLTPMEKKNVLFEEYYKRQEIVPPCEWEAFLESLRSGLPATFRVVNGTALTGVVLEKLDRYIAAEIESGKERLRRVPWYPDGLAFEIRATRQELRSDDNLKPLHRLVVEQANIGAVYRQELASMLPPIFLDITSDDQRILDMCAAPGSKTSQLLEALHVAAGRIEVVANYEAPPAAAPLGGDVHRDRVCYLERNPRGVVVANDLNTRRGHMLINHLRHFNSPSCIVTTHAAQHFPKLFIEETLMSSHAESASTATTGRLCLFEYDLVLCDVPCSSDGTFRKTPAMWDWWHPHKANSLHLLQLNILHRALSLCRIGGRVVYSTCSLNPIENEAVIAALLMLSKRTVKIVDSSDKVKSLPRRPGLIRWSLLQNGHWSDNFDLLPENVKGIKRVASTMYPPKRSNCLSTTETLHSDHGCEDDACWVLQQLPKASRILPHLADTGGFFICVLEKLGTVPWDKPSKSLKGHHSEEYNGSITTHSVLTTPAGGDATLIANHSDHSALPTHADTTCATSGVVVSSIRVAEGCSSTRVPQTDFYPIKAAVRHNNSSTVADDARLSKDLWNGLFAKYLEEDNGSFDSSRLCDHLFGRTMKDGDGNAISAPISRKITFVSQEVRRMLTGVGRSRYKVVSAGCHCVDNRAGVSRLSSGAASRFVAALIATRHDNCRDVTAPVLFSALGRQLVGLLPEDTLFRTLLWGTAVESTAAAPDPTAVVDYRYRLLSKGDCASSVTERIVFGVEEKSVVLFAVCWSQSPRRMFIVPAWRGINHLQLLVDSETRRALQLCLTTT